MLPIHWSPTSFTPGGSTCTYPTKGEKTSSSSTARDDGWRTIARRSEENLAGAGRGGEVEGGRSEKKVERKEEEASRASEEGGWEEAEARIARGWEEEVARVRSLEKEGRGRVKTVSRSWIEVKGRRSENRGREEVRREGKMKSWEEMNRRGESSTS